MLNIGDTIAGQTIRDEDFSFYASSLYKNTITQRIENYLALKEEPAHVNSLPLIRYSKCVWRRQVLKVCHIFL